MTQDLGVVVKGIQLSTDLELNQDRSCVRTKKDPTKWPIDDENSKGLSLPLQNPPIFSHVPSPILPAAPIAYVYRAPVVGVPSGIISPVRFCPQLIPIASTPISAVASVAPLANGGDLLNPNVPEFVPKAVNKVDEIQKKQSETSASDKSHKPETLKSKLEDNQPALKSDSSNLSAKDDDDTKVVVGGLTEAQVEELWQEVKKKPKPVTRVKRRLQSVDGSELEMNGVQFQFEEEADPPSARTRTYSSSRYSV